MADAVSNTSQTQILAAPQLSYGHANSSKFFSHFLFKVALVTIFLVLLPLFPSLAPDFINQTLHARSWELLQLIFVGIAVSYGLFSKKNDETAKDQSSKTDNAQSYVSKLLQVSLVLDDESENQTVIEENKSQTLNSQYYSGEPVVLVTKESTVAKEDNSVISQISPKPLLLPIRSLKQRVPGSNAIDLAIESGEKNGLVNSSSSRSGSKKNSCDARNSRNRDVGGMNIEKFEEKEEENIVLRSPIPWRSRSGRMEMKGNADDSPPFTVSASMLEQELNRFESRSFRSSGPGSAPKNLSSSPSISTQKLSPSTSFSPDSQAKSSEAVVRKNFSSPPPAPPLPGPQFLRKSVLLKSNSSIMSNADSPEKLLRRSSWSVPAEEFSDTEMEELPRRVNSGSELKGRIQTDGLAKSVRTFRPSELVMGAEKKSVDYWTKFVDKRGSNEAMQSHVKFLEEEKNEFVKKVLVETKDEESEAETVYQEVEGDSVNREAAIDNSVNEVGPDVDKKADEFIAKFREQIRLQRIETIRRSTAQRAGKTSR